MRIKKEKKRKRNLVHGRRCRQSYSTSRKNEVRAGETHKAGMRGKDA